MKPQYYGLEELIGFIDEPNRDPCNRILKENLDLFKKVQGSTNNHQAWPGGYLDHITEAMNYGIVFYHTLDSIRFLPFSLSDSLLVLFLHDIEKPWAYEIGSDGILKRKDGMSDKESLHKFRAKRLEEYGIKLTPEQQNGMRYVEGEMNDYTNKRRVMGELAAFCHLCDITSARIYHAYPKREGDEWLEEEKLIREQKVD